MRNRKKHQTTHETLPIFVPSTRISTSSRHITSFCAIASALASKGCPRHRRTARRAAVAQPVFCSALSTQQEWRAALAELVAEATYQCLRSEKWSDLNSWVYHICLVCKVGKASWILCFEGFVTMVCERIDFWEVLNVLMQLLVFGDGFVGAEVHASASTPFKKRPFSLIKNTSKMLIKKRLARLLSTLPSRQTYPLKIDGYKMWFPFGEYPILRREPSVPGRFIKGNKPNLLYFSCVLWFDSRLQRHNSHRSWDFAVVHVSGHDDVSVADVTTTLDHSLGTKGACLGAAVNGCGGPGTDHHRNLVWKLLKHQKKRCRSQGKGGYILGIFSGGVGLMMMMRRRLGGVFARLLEPSFWI